MNKGRYSKGILQPFRFILRKVFPIPYVKLQYRVLTGHRLNLKNPIRYTEKLQYLRLFSYPQNKFVSQCASRVGLRDYAISLGLEKYLIPIYGIFDSFEEIDFSTLPAQFVMKCSHACAFNYICVDKSQMNYQEMRKKFKKWLKTDYGKLTIERHYSRIKPQIIIEKYIGELDSLPVEYKVHVFNGIAKSLYVVTGRGKDIRYNNYYADWSPFDGSQFNGWRKSDYELAKPDNFSEMLKLSELLAKPFPFVRVDLYDINGIIYIGEMTFTPAKGTLKLDDDQCDFLMGEWLDIRKELEDGRKRKK